MMSSPPASPSIRWLIINGLIVLFLLGGAVYMVSTDEEMAAVATEAFWGGFTFFTTPFVLETSVALFAILLVGIVNQRRIEREGDGWVLMPRDSAKESAETQGSQSGSNSDSAPKEP
jgi:hypothetical protein